MGRKGGTETLSVVLLAFLEQRTWQQAELARRAGVERKRIAQIMRDLEEAGLPLEREEDHPHVYWSVPKNWFPGAVAFSGKEVSELVRVLQLAPRSATRDQLLSRITAAATGVTRASPAAVVTRPLSAEEETSLAILEESVTRECAARVRYHTLSRGDIAWRFLSIHRLFVEQRRFVATCHRSNQLKWFRLDGVISAELTEHEPYRRAEDAAIERLLNESVDGYHSGAPAVQCVFRVDNAEARWVSRQLPLPFKTREEPNEVVFTAVTAGLLPLARFLVGLGRAVRIETPELRKLVVELARGALGEAEANPKPSKTEHASGALIRGAE